MGVDARVFVPQPRPEAVAYLGVLNGRLQETVPGLSSYVRLVARQCPGHLERERAPTVVMLTNDWRYYGKGYERGPWPTIYLALLFVKEHIGDPVYTHDHAICSDDCRCCWEPISDEQLAVITRHWFRWGNRPYFDRHRLGGCWGR